MHTVHSVACAIRCLYTLIPQEAYFSDTEDGAGNTTVASASWDKTVRLWDTYSGSKSATDILQHTHEVVAIAMHPGGRYLAASTLNGEICFWDTQEATIHGVIEARLPEFISSLLHVTFL